MPSIKFTGYKPYFLGIAIVIIAALAALFLILPGGSARQAAAAAGVPNIMPPDVAAVIPNATYVPVEEGAITLFPYDLRSEGYIKSSTTLFNLSSSYSTKEFPRVIASAVFVMTNSSAANAALEGLLFSNNANQSVRGFVYNGTSASNYTIGNTSIEMYTVYSVAVFNASVINSSAQSLLRMPDYQYTTVFAYRNYTATVVVDSFVPSNEFGIYSVQLAEKLFATIVSSK